MAKINHFLISGGTGAIGSAIVPLLVEKKAPIYLLIRGADNEEVQKKFLNLKRFWNLPNIDEWVMPIRGDVEEIGLGLSKDDEFRVTNDVTNIIHSAGKVRMNLPLEEARSAAVGSTQNILNFSKRCPNFNKLEFVSTVGVAGRTIPQLEELYYSEKRSYHNTYEQSKAEAEMVLEKAMQEIPVTLHRPSMVVGDSSSGKIIHFQIFYYLCEFLSGNKTFGFMPKLGNTTLDIVPSDYVAKAIVESSYNNGWAGKVLHLSSGTDALPLEALKKHVRKYWQKNGLILPKEIDLPLVAVKGGLFLIKPFLTAKMKKMISTLPIFLDYLESRQTFSNHKTIMLLEEHGINLPKPEGYLEHLFEFYFNNKNTH